MNDERTRKGLHESRLSTTDEKGHRVWLFPEDVKGIWRNRRSFTFWPLILFYLIVPWIYIDGKQVILLDLPKREFHFFGTTFFGHDAPLLVFLFLGFPLVIAFITSIWGRVWCGWACPQTVFIDAIYAKIERLIEGNGRARKKLKNAPWNFNKISKKAFKWFLFLLISLHISHSFLGYFVGTHNLVHMSMQGPFENFTTFSIMLFLTGLFLFDFGFFREQFCIIACPYGRFQSVMMDDQTLQVSYDFNRGEPRRNNVPEGQTEGDCIDCLHCIKVCPTGIDIRNGNQLECIHCTNCIDACDEIMTKIGNDKGLIRYASEAQLDGKERKTFRPRSFAYLAAILTLISIFTYAIFSKQILDVKIFRASKVPYTFRIVDGKNIVTNHYKITLSLKNNKNSTIKILVKNNNIKLIMSRNPFIISKGTHKKNIFFKFDKSVLKNGSFKTSIDVYENNKLISTIEVPLVGPVN